MPHSRCNCRCIMCDIWKANAEKKELSVEYLQQHVDSFSKLGVRHVTLSGGEALMHSNLWSLFQLLKKTGIRMSLLSTGLTLERHAQEIINYFDEVIVSIDGSLSLRHGWLQFPGTSKAPLGSILCPDRAAATSLCSGALPILLRYYMQY